MHKNNNLISIAMATYNGEQFISKQIESILQQTYKNFELIITDDASSDNTVKIIQQYIKKDSRIHLYINDKNLGFIKNFEKAISLCNGEYIALADQDDIWKEYKLELFLKNIKNNILIYSDAEIIDKEGKTLNATFIQPKKNLIQGKNTTAFLFNNCISGNTMMFHKSILKFLFPIPEKFLFHDQWIAFIASQLGTITYTKKEMIYYRRYSEQITSDNKKSYSSFLKKFHDKQHLHTVAIQQNLLYYKMLKKLSFIDNSTHELLKLLIEHQQKSMKGYFNSKLYRYLRQHKDTFFAIKRKRKRSKEALKLSIQFKLRKLFLFSI